MYGLLLLLLKSVAVLGRLPGIDGIVNRQGSRGKKGYETWPAIQPMNMGVVTLMEIGRSRPKVQTGEGKLKMSPNKI